MKEISSGNYSVFVGGLENGALQKLLNSKQFKDAQKLILIDENSLEYCFPKLINSVPALEKAELLEIESGEESKSIEVATQIWEALSEMEIRRDAVLINLGGGVIGDLGGFVAATYKRGIRFIHIPTTLLAMVDASVGGKVGIDLNRLKNQVGVFCEPDGVFVDNEFLRTLPKNQTLSGFAEIIKHALISDVAYWDEVKQTSLHDLHENRELITKSIELKNKIVLEDPKEKGPRKLLNFGHTIGHAVETHSMETATKSLLHGEAIAIGMICEAYLSFKLNGFPRQQLDEVVEFIKQLYAPFEFEEMAGHRLIELMRNDKKNTGPQINFTLLNEIGSAVYDQKADASDILDALNFYNGK
jgi:3-dehydroquinate synthase